MRVAVSTVWYGLDEKEKEVYGPYRYCLHHCYTALLDRGGIVPFAVLPVKNAPLEQVLRGSDMLLLTGGGDPDPSLFNRRNEGSRNPERDRPLWDMELYRAAVKLGIPVLGICLGMQIIGIAHGTGLIQNIDSPVFHDGTCSNRVFHPVTVEKESALYGALGNRLKVSSWHHQALDGVPDGFIVSARSDDGLIEAIESHDGLVTGVQWHPERDSTGNALMNLMMEKLRSK
jgi:putative glutamine amidotransferase